VPGGGDGEQPVLGVVAVGIGAVRLEVGVAVVAEGRPGRDGVFAARITAYSLSSTERLGGGVYDERVTQQRRLARNVLFRTPGCVA
jgi:hypothetical protein